MKRWLAGIAIFALGFGCANIMQVTTADAQDTEMEDGLHYSDTGGSYVVTNTGEFAYLAVVHRNSGTQVSEPLFGSKAETAEFSKQDLVDVTIHRITPVGRLVPTEQPQFVLCDPPQDFVDCPVPRPLPFPPPPMMFIEPKWRPES
ncbi:MAG TPA: hypothetical protein VE078_12915 [Thermoanaerobaculia bacterium]|nr:hypothetical protein [Thermoanaerobaculia bacterium]